jgi:hypothetical protein
MKMRRENEEIKEEDEDRSESRQEFRESFDTLGNKEKGNWCERAVIKEADEAGQVILVEHCDNPNAHGFDCVSMDPETRELHLWEAKNYGNRPVGPRDLTAWQDQNKEGEAREGYRRSWQDVIDSVPDGPARDAVKKAINEGKVNFHLRLGPETKITPELQRELEEAQVPGAKYDCKRYDYDEFLSIGA